MIVKYLPFKFLKKNEASRAYIRTSQIDYSFACKIKCLENQIETIQFIKLKQKAAQCDCKSVSCNP